MGRVPRGLLLKWVCHLGSQGQALACLLPCGLLHLHLMVTFPSKKTEAVPCTATPDAAAVRGDGDRMCKHQGPRGQKGLLPDRGQEASDALRDSASQIDIWGWGRITDIKGGELG